MVRIIGIDPGLRNTGWGVIEQDGQRLSYVADGSVHSDVAAGLPERLLQIQREMQSALDDVSGTLDTLFEQTGGRRNPQLMKAFAARLSVPVTAAEDHGWRGDSIEAEAFAYLAARTVRGLAISYPKTTGVAAPMTGGRVARPTA